MTIVESVKRLIEENCLVEKTLTLERGEFLKVNGSIDTNIYLIDAGSVRVFIMDEYEEQIIRFGYQGDIIVAVDSFLTESPSSIYMQCLKRTVLRVVQKSKFMAIIHSNIENLKLWNSILEFLILQQMEREKDILTASPQERFKRVLKRSPQLFQEIPNKYIASYLRMTPETLSRLKKS